MIQINEKYRINADERNVIVEMRNGTRKTGARAGQEIWEAQTYHHTLYHALKSIRQRNGLYSLSDEILEPIEKAIKQLAELDQQFEQYAGDLKEVTNKKLNELKLAL